jgi:hypothetical protein
MLVSQLSSVLVFLEIYLNVPDVQLFNSFPKTPI